MKEFDQMIRSGPSASRNLLTPVVSGESNRTAIGLDESYGKLGVTQKNHYAYSPAVVTISLTPDEALELGMRLMFWGQGQKNKPAPTLAEKAKERGWNDISRIIVKSLSDAELSYRVDLSKSRYTCTCPDYMVRGLTNSKHHCKHITSVLEKIG